MNTDTDIAVIGAGPYGLSICAHLRDLGVDHRTFGQPMHSWLREMPKGMKLKSEGFASDIYDPYHKFTLKAFCQQNGLPYEDMGLPVPLSTFTSYGLEFQRELVPHVENKTIVDLLREKNRFRLKFDDGEIVTARRVIIAVGVTYFRYIPSVLAHLPSSILSHSAQYGALDHLHGRRVFVIGGGASAIDIAGLLGELGSDVHLIARQPELQIHAQAKLPRPYLDRIRHPMSGIGPGWRSLFFCEAPGAFSYLPERVRDRQVKHHLGPAAGWFMRRYTKNISLHLGAQIASVKASADGKVALEVIKNDSFTEQFESEHIIAATGYRVDIDQIPFLDPELRSQIKRFYKIPELSRDFQSSIPGPIFCVGPAAAKPHSGQL